MADALFIGVYIYITAHMKETTQRKDESVLELERTMSRT